MEAFETNDYGSDSVVCIVIYRTTRCDFCAHGGAVTTVHLARSQIWKLKPQTYLDPTIDRT